MYNERLTLWFLLFSYNKSEINIKGNVYNTIHITYCITHNYVTYRLAYLHGELPLYCRLIHATVDAPPWLWGSEMKDISIRQTFAAYSSSYESIINYLLCATLVPGTLNLWATSTVDCFSGNVFLFWVVCAGVCGAAPAICGLRLPLIASRRMFSYFEWYVQVFVGLLQQFVNIWFCTFDLALL